MQLGLEFCIHYAHMDLARSRPVKFTEKNSLPGAEHQSAVFNGDQLRGTWQGIFFREFDGPRTRKIHVRILKAEFQS